MSTECARYHTLHGFRQFPTKAAFKDAVGFGVPFHCNRCGLGSDAGAGRKEIEPGERAVFTVPSYKWYARVTRPLDGSGLVVE